MLIKELTRINELARLRRAYLAAIRGNINTMLATATVIDAEGRDVTPGKLRAAQASGTMQYI